MPLAGERPPAEKCAAALYGAETLRRDPYRNLDPGIFATETLRQEYLFDLRDRFLEKAEEETDLHRHRGDAAAMQGQQVQGSAEAWNQPREPMLSTAEGPCEDSELEA